MKKLSILSILFFCFATVAHAEPQYFVAIQEKPDLKLSDGSNWTLEIGEVFPFVRWVSASELRGGAASPEDKSYALVQMDDKTLVVPAASIRVVPQKDIPAAAMTYRQLVQQSRANTVDPLQMLELLKALQGDTSVPTTSSGISKNDRFKMLRILRSAGLVSSIRGSEQLSDEEIIRLMGIYQQRQEQQRLRNLEAEVQRLRQQR